MNYTVGIDSGSTATKGILLADGVIVRRFLCPTPFRPADAIHEAWETLRAGLTETPFLTLTGYGRQLVDFADKQVTEISCHGLGARLLAPDTRTVIDIGGQDSKVIQLDAGGNLSDFLMNDKCAAGTGRFLEVISRTLGASVQQLDAITDGVEPHAITSMCTVFAESEVISLRSAGVAPEAILAGVINAMARRSANFIGRLSAQGPLIGAGAAAVYRRRQPLRRLCPDAGKPCRHGGDNPSRRPVCRGDRRGADRPAPAEARMTTFLFLFHSTVGVVRMRKAMQAAGVAFEVKDIPRQLRSGCGLCILLEGTEADARGWIVPEQTAALYQQNGEAWRCLATFPPAG